MPQRIPATADWKLVGSAIREARRARRPRLSQARLGELVGLTQGAISRIESGEVTTTDSLSAITQALGLDLAVQVGPTQAAPALSADLAELLGQLRELSQDELNGVRQLVRGLPHMPTGLKVGLLHQFEFYGAEFGSSSRSLSNLSRA
jgi:transcriptional regulator with XRE-family HTH domain